MTAVASAGSAVSQDPVFSTSCAGKAYTYNELAGYGFVPSDARDKLGDSISLGSSIAMASWSKKGSKYEGRLYGLPDRGWNTQGTINFQPRVHEFLVTLTPAPDATAANPSAPNVAFAYQDSILLTGPDGAPMTGLDADQTGGLQYPGFPLLPAATYTGDGFGGEGPGGKRVSLDPEALVLAKDGGFWISDEYGPYIYNFDKNGSMTAAVAPPDAPLPLRNGTVSFSSNNPPAYDPTRKPIPSNPTQGRQNNQGFEGMTASPDGKTLWVLLQSAARQEGGSSSTTRRYARLLRYSIESCEGNGQAVVYQGEYVVPLPTFRDASGKTAVAAQSEMHYVSDTQFFFLPRDSGNGHGLASSESIYRHVDILDISNATNVKGPAHDAFNASIASAAGVLNSDIAPATVCPFVDFNVNAQLNRFGLHNGGPQDGGLLNEKWEGIALVPTENKDGRRDGEEYLLFASSDNDFVTQNGFVNFGKIPFADKSGFDLDNQMLVFRITLPKGARPLVG
ncbi:outer membrane autotransporter [Metarhizium acridum CQMa 102]|uniref:Outer membrane autotransporter n=1 Tax=Metarhizium acridum (strain CQMa 102) TaxID=655827 RepID=E9EEH8_METAQ|nr:outer membrane autotransporter [Metarhizium acridum CQMa 102]EFY85685.1 outer membrane autotransporter [Metarhizium acridum CQMa 102]